MKIIIFEYRKGRNDVKKEEVEFEDDATENEIDEEYSQWIVQQIADNCTWYEKEED